MGNTKERAEPLMFTQTVSHKARELRLSEQTVRQLADNGELPHVRDSNGKRLFRPGDRGSRS